MTETATINPTSSNSERRAQYQDVGNFEIKLSKILPSPDNPRKHFDEDQLQSLANSLASHGQMQNITIRAKDSSDIFHDNDPGIIYEIISGERRFRAAQRANLTSLQCKVIVCDDVTAIELRGIENYRRADFNAIEEAIWFQQLLETGEYNQGTLAKFLEIDQSQVSNRLRLLKLPEEWQTKVIWGVLSATQARELASWSDRPQILSDIEQKSQLSPFSTITVATMQTWILTSLHAHSRSLDPSRMDGPHFPITDELLAELDVVDVPEFLHSQSKRPRAFNVELWDRLQAEARSAATTRVTDSLMPDQTNSQKEPSANSSDSSSAAGKAASDEPTGITDDDLHRYFLRLFRIAIRNDIANAPEVSYRLLVSLMMDITHSDYLVDRLIVAFGKDDEVSFEIAAQVDVFLAMKGFGSKALNRHLVTVLRELFESNHPLDELLVSAVVHEMGLSPLIDWIPPRELLEKCSKDQLSKLFTEEMGAKRIARLGRERMLDELLKHWPPGYLPELLKCQFLEIHERGTGGGDDA